MGNHLIVFQKPEGEDIESSEEADWQYGCWNILDRFDELYPDLRNPAKQINMKRFDIPTSWSSRDHSWIDEIRFAKQEIEIFRHGYILIGKLIFFFI